MTEIRSAGVRAGCLALLMLVAIQVFAADSAPSPKGGERSAQAELVWPSPPLAPRIRYLGSVSTPADLGRQKGFWRRVWDLFLGEERDERLVRPMSVVTDSQDRLIVADSAARLVHIFDRKRREYSTLRGSDQDPLILPIGVAVDDADSIYVADGEQGKVYVFKSNGDFDRVFGRYAWLRRPMGLAIDRGAKRLYVVDTPSHDVKVFDLPSGELIKTMGERGTNAGEFNFPTYIATDRLGRVYVTDSLNSRVQVFDPEGRFVSTIGKQGDGSGDLSAPKGVSMDSEGHVYVADADFDNVQIFDASGHLLLYWGSSGTEPGQFWLPTGLFVDGQDRVYVADSYNNRVQIFQYLKAPLVAK